MNKMVTFDTQNITDSDRILHTPGEFARKNLYYIQEVGRLKSLKPHVSSRSELDSFLFFIVVKGSGRVTIGGREHKVSEGNAVFIDCMEPYEHISDEENPWELAWVHFNGPKAREYYDLFLSKNDGSQIYAIADTDRYYEIITMLMNDGREDKDIVSELEASSHLTGLMTHIIKDVIAIESGKGKHNLSKLRETVNERFREENLFENLCSENGFDEMAINKEYKDKYGIDLCDYILNRRFTYAKELLRFTVKPVKEVVQESGIKNSDLFRHLFIENEGMTAEEYRSKWSQWNRG